MDQLGASDSYQFTISQPEYMCRQNFNAHLRRQKGNNVLAISVYLQVFVMLEKYLMNYLTKSMKHNQWMYKYNWLTIGIK